METKNPRCAGIDVHKDSLKVAARVDGQVFVQTFGATSAEIFAMADWLDSLGVKIVAMESTGVYWKPVWNLLEDRFELILANAHHVKSIPGCKTDVKDCNWVAELLEYGLVHKRMEAKKPALRAALEGRVTEHHRFMLRQALDQIDHLDRQIQDFDRRIDQVMSPLEREAVKRLDAVPGLDVRSAQIVLAEIGTDMSRFPSSRHLASWAGLCPGNHESAGKRRSGRTRQGNGYLKATLWQAGWGASRNRRSYFSAQHKRLTTRRGVKRANMAVAHSLLVTCYHLIKTPQDYKDLGPDYFQKTPDPERSAQQMVKRLQKLGYSVKIERVAA